MIGSEPLAGRTVCSRAGCNEDARWRIEWRNPAIHGEDRVKVWTACDDHVDFLRQFLGARSFPLRVLAIDEPIASIRPARSSPDSPGSSDPRSPRA